MSGVLGLDGLDLPNVSPPSYFLRVKVKFTGFLKEEFGLIGSDEEKALLEIKKRFDGKDKKNESEEYFLIRKYWDLPIIKGADMNIEEAPLEIVNKKEDWRKKGDERWNWTVKKKGYFIKVSR